MSGRRSSQGDIIQNPLPRNVPAQPKLFYLIGYVSPAGDFVRSTDTIDTDFGTIYSEVPAVTQWVVVRADDEVWVVDLHEAMQLPNIHNRIGVDLYVGDYIAFPEPNAAIAAAVMMRR